MSVCFLLTDNVCYVWFVFYCLVSFVVCRCWLACVCCGLLFVFVRCVVGCSCAIINDVVVC